MGQNKLENSDRQLEDLLSQLAKWELAMSLLERCGLTKLDEELDKCLDFGVMGARGIVRGVRYDLGDGLEELNAAQSRKLRLIGHQGEDGPLVYELLSSLGSRTIKTTGDILGDLLGVHDVLHTRLGFAEKAQMLVEYVKYESDDAIRLLVLDKYKDNQAVMLRLNEGTFHIVGLEFVPEIDDSGASWGKIRLLVE